MNSTKSSSIAEAARWLREADYVIVGAGAGLSTAAGLRYDGPDFEAFFADFIAKYGFTDLYTSSFYDFPCEEERWAYWAKHVMYARILPEAKPLYKALFELVRHKDYFVFTTNVDGQFRKAGFDPARLFEVQGDYAYIQSRSGSDGRRYDATDLFRRMYNSISDCRIPTALVPTAQGGEPMEINIRKDDGFVEDAQWKRQAETFYRFIARAHESRLVLLELGVGFNTPTIIRYPFEQMVQRFRHTALIRFNKEYPQTQLPLERHLGFTRLDVATLRALASASA